ncbi:MAG: hypothetical protein JRI25_25440, partial [Deltaproteobacteria bacterium]|nr:hypothetical protein [Deltaproteobacteria bacterium]
MKRILALSAALFLVHGSPTATAAEAGELEQSCDGGDAAACKTLGILRARSDDMEGALTSFERACDADYAPGCREAGGLFVTNSLGHLEGASEK